MRAWIPIKDILENAAQINMECFSLLKHWTGNSRSYLSRADLKILKVKTVQLLGKLTDNLIRRQCLSNSLKVILLASVARKLDRHWN